MFQEHTFLHLLVDLGHRNGEVGLVVPVEAQGLVGLALVPFSHQKEKDQACQAVAVAGPVSANDLIGSDHEQPGYSDGDG